jgi:hypothetical protein
MSVRTLTLGRQEADAMIQFNSESFPISSSVFCCLSSKYRRMFANSENPILIETTAGRNSVVEFINACQLKDYFVTHENVHDLLSLARDWDVSSLEQSVLEYISKPENRSKLLIPSICDAFSRCQDSSSIERELQLHLNEFLDDDSLLKLPLVILS